ncbi:MAG: SDR family oxidoreductase [Novosphingobium sp.]
MHERDIGNIILVPHALPPVDLPSCADNPELEEYCKSVHPIGRFGEPIEEAEVAMWLLSDAASFVTGIVMPVDGGYTAV